MQTLNSDFHLLTGFSSNLFDWTASKWYWRYHEKVRGVKWQPLSIALKAQFKDSKADRNLRSEIEQRKQRSIAALADKVTEQLSETALVEILRAEFLPDIQHEVLYESTSTVVLKREIFMKTLPKSQPHFSRLVRWPLLRLSVTSRLLLIKESKSYYYFVEKRRFS